MALSWHFKHMFIPLDKSHKIHKQKKILSQITHIPLRRKYSGEFRDVLRVSWVLRCSIHNNKNYGSDSAGLPHLEELLASSFDPDISDSEGEVGG